MIHPKHIHPDYEHAIAFVRYAGYRQIEHDELPEKYKEVIGAETYWIDPKDGHMLSVSMCDATVRDVE